MNYTNIARSIDTQSVKAAQYVIYKNYHQRMVMFVPNAVIGSNEIDMLCVRRSGFIDEFEIKMTTSDYHADFKKETLIFDDDGVYERKNKHEAMVSGELKPNYFHFVIREGIVDPKDIDDRYGVVVLLDKGGYYIARDASRLHGRKITEEMKCKLAMKLHWRWWRNLEREVEMDNVSGKI